MVEALKPIQPVTPPKQAPGADSVSPEKYQSWKKAYIHYYRYEKDNNQYVRINSENIGNYPVNELYAMVSASSQPIISNLSTNGTGQAMALAGKNNDVLTQKIIFNTITRKTYENWKNNYVCFFFREKISGRLTKITAEQAAIQAPEQILAVVFDPFNGYHSEGLAWGLLSSVHFGEARLFGALVNGLKLFEKHGLPSWRVSLNNSAGEFHGNSYQVLQTGGNFILLKNGQKILENQAADGLTQQISGLFKDAEEKQFIIKLVDDLTTNDGQPRVLTGDQSSASDADQDITSALIKGWQLAEKGKWLLPSGLSREYLMEEMLFYLRRVREDEAEYNGLSYIFRPSQDWGASGIGVGTSLNVSYPQASFFKLFGEYDPDGDHVWNELAKSTLKYRRILVTGKEGGRAVGFSEPNPEEMARSSIKENMTPFQPPDWVAVGRSVDRELYYRIPNLSSKMGVTGIRTFLRIAYDAVYGDGEVKEKSIALAREIVDYYQNQKNYQALVLDGQDKGKSDLYKTMALAALAKAAALGQVNAARYQDIFQFWQNELVKNNIVVLLPGNSEDYFLNSLNLLSQIILADSYSGVPNLKIWTAHHNREVAVIAESTPGSWSARLPFGDMGLRAARLDMLNVANSLNSVPDDRKKNTANLYNDLDLAQRLLAQKRFKGAIQEYCSIIRWGDYRDDVHKKYMETAFDGVEGAFLDSGMSAQEFLKYVENILPANSNASNPYLKLTHAKAIFLTYDPDRFKQFQTECGQIIGDEIHKSEGDYNPLIVARAMILLVNSFLTIRKEFLSEADWQFMPVLVKLASGQELSPDEKIIIRAGGFPIIGDHVDVLADRQKKLSQYLKNMVTPSMFAKDRPNNIYNFPYQSQDNFSYLLSFYRARGLMALAMESTQLDQKKKNGLLKEALLLLFLSLNQMPQTEKILDKPSFKRMAIDIVKTIDSVYRGLYQSEKKPAYLHLSFLVPAYLFREAFKNPGPVFPGTTIIGSDILSEIRKNMKDADYTPKDWERVRTALQRTRDSIDQNSYEESWASLTGKSIPQIVPGALNCLLEMDRARISENPKGVPVGMNLSTGLDQLPTNRVRQCFDRVYYYLVLGEDQRAADYVNEIGFFIRNVENGFLQSGTQIYANRLAIENNLKNISRGIREGLQAMQDFEPAARIKMDYIALLKNAVVSFYDPDTNAIKNVGFRIFWTSREKERFRYLCGRIYSLIVKIEKNSDQTQSVAKLLSGYDKMKDLESLVSMAETLAERIKMMEYFSRLRKTNLLRYKMEIKILAGIRDFQPLIETGSLEQMEKIHNEKLQLCSARLHQMGYSQDNYQELIEFGQDLVWLQARPFLVELKETELTSQSLNQVRSNPNLLLAIRNSKTIISEILDLPRDGRDDAQLPPEVKKYIEFFRDPESYGMKAQLFVKKPHLKKEFYLLLAVISVIEGNEGLAVDSFNKAYYSNPNDRQVFIWAGRLVPPKGRRYMVFEPETMEKKLREKLGDK